MKPLRFLATTSLLSLALVSTAALAQDAAASNPFDALDTDHDGVLSAQEGHQHPVVDRSFAKADANGDGKLTRDEFNAAFTTRQQSAPPESTPNGQTAPPQSPPPQ